VLRLLSMSKVIFLPFLLRLLTAILFSFPSKVAKRHVTHIHFPCKVTGSKNIQFFIFLPILNFIQIHFIWKAVSILTYIINKPAIAYNFSQFLTIPNVSQKLSVL